MVGSNTALADNPGLQVRDWTGPNPLRVVIDRNNKLPGGLELFSGKEPTLLFTSEIVDDGKNVEKVLINDGEDPIDAVLGELYKRNIQSLIVEGVHSSLAGLLSATCGMKHAYLLGRWILEME